MKVICSDINDLSIMTSIVRKLSLGVKKLKEELFVR